MKSTVSLKLACNLKRSSFESPTPKEKEFKQSENVYADKHKQVTFERAVISRVKKNICPRKKTAATQGFSYVNKRGLFFENFFRLLREC